MEAHKSGMPCFFMSNPTITAPLRGNFALARNLHTRNSNTRYTKLDYSRATIKGITRESLLTRRYSHIIMFTNKV